AVLLKIAVVQPNVIGRLTAQHHLELGEAEEERVVAINQRYANRVGDPLREPRRELQSAEPGPEDQDVLAHRQHTTPGRLPGPGKAIDAWNHNLGSTIQRSVVRELGFLPAVSSGVAI